MKKLLGNLHRTYLSKYEKVRYPKIYWVDKSKKEEPVVEEPVVEEPVVEDSSGDFKNLSFQEKMLNKKTWQDGFNLTKENIGITLILISGLGAVIQIIELMKIDISYLRFFSVTQLSADGALASITVLLSFIVYRLHLITYTSLSIIPRLEKAIENKDNRYFPNELMHVIGLFIGVKGAAIFLNREFFGDRIIELGIISSMMLATLYFVSKYFLLVRKFFKVTNASKQLLIPSNLLAVISVGMTMYALAKVAGIYIELYRIPTPERLDNYQYLESRIERDYGITEKYKILYFNDRYTFVEIEKDKRIIIYKTDDVLFSVRHTIIVDGANQE